MELPASAVDTDEKFGASYDGAVESDDPEAIIEAVDRVHPDSRPPYDFAFIKQRVRAAMGIDD